MSPPACGLAPTPSQSCQSSLPSSSSSSPLSHHSHPLGEPWVPQGAAAADGSGGAGSLVTCHSATGHCWSLPLPRALPLFVQCGPKGWPCSGGSFIPAVLLLFWITLLIPRAGALPRQQHSPRISDGVSIGQGRAQWNPDPAIWEGIKQE